MVRMIGNADEFWRIRLTRVDTTDHFDFEWHDDILYREPTVERGEEVEYFHVEAVRLDNSEEVVRVASFEDPNQAKDMVAELREALAQMSKSEFESAYLEGAEPGDTGVE